MPLIVCPDHWRGLYVFSTGSHMIGLGKEMPVDDGHTRAARAKNRRVEIKIFSAASSSYALSQAPAPSSPQQAQAQ